MRKSIIALTALIIAILFLSSIGATVFYYNNILNDKDTRISLLESQITNQSNQITGLNTQISNIESQMASIVNLTYPSARISAITEDTTYPGAVVGVTRVILLYVNVMNTGLVDVNNATVSVQNVGANSISQGKYSDNQSVSLHPNQTSRVVCSLWMELNKYGEAKGLNYLISVTCNGTVLDERYYTIPN